MTFICPDSLNMCSLSSYKQRERRECGYSRRFYRLNVYTTNLYPPTGNLDSRSGGEVMELLEKVCTKMGRALVVITHDSRIASMARRRLSIVDGIVTEVACR